MVRLRISAPAERDIAVILATSEERWGSDARDRYGLLLAAAMRQLAADPRGAGTVHCGGLAKGARSFHLRHTSSRNGVEAPVHVIYYRAVEDRLEVVRVLHERMEPSRHLPSRRPRSRSRR
jgi:toxin ParE1/3/4